MRDDRYKKVQWLLRYRKSKANIELLQMQIEELRLAKMFPSVQADGMPHGHANKDMSDYAVKLDTLERKLERERERHLVHVHATYDAVNNLPDVTPDQVYKTVLQYRYIHGMQFEEIQAVMHGSRTAVYNWHMGALDLLQV